MCGIAVITTQVQQTESVLVDKAVDERSPRISHKLFVGNGQLRSFSSITFALPSTFLGAMSDVTLALLATFVKLSVR